MIKEVDLVVTKKNRWFSWYKVDLYSL